MLACLPRSTLHCSEAGGVPPAAASLRELESGGRAAPENSRFIGVPHVNSVVQLSSTSWPLLPSSPAADTGFRQTATASTSSASCETARAAMVRMWSCEGPPTMS